MDVLKVKNRTTNQWETIPAIQGDSGVYYGSTPPADPSVRVWIDPSGTPTLLDIFRDFVYPVGSYYWSSEPTNPSTLFGGTWVQIKDRFILAAGDNYTAGNTGGEAEHTLTKAELPAERLRLQYADGRVASWGLAFSSGSNAGGVIISSGNGMFTEAMGSGTAHNNMPPYEVAYCWKRTA